MKATEEKIPGKEVRNLSVYREDLKDFDLAAEATERSRVRLFRWIVSEWKAGRAVYAPVGKPQFKRQQKEAA